MAEEIQTQKNTVATVGMRFSIIGLILLITVVFSWIGLILLFIGFILWIVGLFSKPRGKARAAVLIPLLVFIAGLIAWLYVWNSVKTPAMEFVNYVENKMAPIDPETLDDERFEYLLEVEANKVFKNIKEDERKSMYDASTGKNAIQKWSYLIFGLLQQAFDTAWEKYESWELPEAVVEDNIVDVDVSVNEDEEEDTQVTESAELVEVQEEAAVKKPTETFDDKEKQDIEQVLNLLQ